MNTLDGIDLGDIVLETPLNPKLDSIINIASDGSVIVYEKDRLYDMLRLYGGDDWGFVDFTTMSLLKSMASVKGATYSLIYDTKSYIVRFRTEESPIRGTPINPHVSESEYNNIEILLMEV